MVGRMCIYHSTDGLTHPGGTDRRDFSLSRQISLSLLCAGQARQTGEEGAMTEGRSGRRARQVDPELKSETLFQKERTERARQGGKHKTRGTASDAKKEITGSAVKSNFRTESKNQGRSGCKGSRFLSLSSCEETKVGQDKSWV
jgi:hypothetical protein